MIEIRPCRLDECSTVLTLWTRAGAVPSPTDSLAEVTRLAHAHPGSLLVAIDWGAVVGSVIGGWDGWRGNIYRLAVAPEARRHGPRAVWSGKPSARCKPRAPAASQRASSATNPTPSPSRRIATTTNATQTDPSSDCSTRS